MAAYVFGIPLLIGVVRDWLFASGRLDSRSIRYRQVRRFASRLLTQLLPLLWRVLLPLAMAGILALRVQPLAAATVSVLGTLPLILGSALEQEGRRDQFFRPVQWAVAGAMIVTGLGLGYRG